MSKVRELLRLKFQAKLTHRQIARAIAISPSTVSCYAQAAQQAQLTWPIPETWSDDTLKQQLEPFLQQLRGSSPYVLPDWPGVHQQLQRKHVTLQLLWEDYARLHPEQHYSYTHYTRLYRAWCQQQRLSCRLVHPPGEEGFIDYAGTTLPIHDRRTGQVSQQAQLFVMVLGASSYTFATATASQQSADWIDAHVQAFQYFGGVPKLLVPDNLKAGITDACCFEPEANPTYAALAQHYQTAILPARPRKPKDKALAENTVLIASRWLIARLQRQRFYSLAALNRALAELLSALNHKPFQKRQGSRAEQFKQFEQAALLPLPTHPFAFAEFSDQQVPADYHVRLDDHYYSVPHTYAHQPVTCRVTVRTVEVFYQHQRIAAHPRSAQRDGKTTCPEHRPPAHRSYQDWTPQTLVQWGKQQGTAVCQVAQRIIQQQRHPEQCRRIHWGLQRLARRFGAPLLNQACQQALAQDCVRFKSIASLLETGLVHQHPNAPTAVLSAPLHANVRGAQYYQPSEYH